MIRKNYQRNRDEESAITDLQEELNLSYEQAKEVFEKEIKNIENLGAESETVLVDKTKQILYN